ncbi:hypothetical protein C7Y47_24145 [Lysinibacillus sphaericus]|uniref:Uncharacterized protein n=1 Tax=Lysinibacillus sphaericus TaxID=1421 RepID=A0A544U7B0_LYSSH|nr:hypothetical protein [Lysinibacillus sp. SDF0037]TQR26828.1 hypothetical protein C7Y47_24145 [Lysinibacillus sp. SDF0037]
MIDAISKVGNIVVFLLLPILLFSYLYLMLLSRMVNRSSFKKAKKIFRKKKKVPLFEWIADEPSVDVLMYEILKSETTSNNLKEDLLKIKNEVEEYVGDDINNYLLLKEILNQRLSSGIESMMRNFIKTTFASIFTSAITTMVINKFEIDFVNSIILLFGVCIVIMVGFFSYNFMFTRKRNRIEILIVILDSIITDKSN